MDEPPPVGNITPEVVFNNTKAGELVGCHYPAHHWCITVPKIYLFQYVTALILIAIGYPTSSVLCYSIYSKILGPSKQVCTGCCVRVSQCTCVQGAMMGVLTGAGSLARTLGPLFVSTLYDETGPEVTFTAVVGVVALSIVFMTIFYHRLLPYRTHTHH